MDRKLIAAVFTALIVASPALAGFFDGYTAHNADDQDTMNYIMDLETRGYNQWALINVEPEYSVANGASISSGAFREGVRQAVREVHNVPETCGTPGATYIDTLWNGWQRYNDDKRPGEFWSNRLYYKVPAGPSSAWKQPVVVINDGMGAFHSIGLTSRGYEGEDVAQILLEAGHPVLVMALKGMDDKYFAGVWNIHGLHQFESFLKARGDTTVSVWVRDAYDAVCLIQRWHPGEQIGITGVSKSGIVAASAALLHDGVNKVYLASGFSAMESKYPAINSWGYGFGERGRYERSAVLAAMYDKDVRLSYSTNDSIMYRVEAAEGRLLQALNALRSAWSKPLVAQFSTSPSHYYAAADVIAFFG